MSQQSIQLPNAKKLIHDFLLNGRMNTNESTGNSENDTNIETSKSQQYYINPSIYHHNQSDNKSAMINLNYISPTQNRSNTECDRTSANSNYNNYYNLNNISNPTSKPRFIKLKDNKRGTSNPQLQPFAPFLHERDSLGNLLKDQERQNRLERNYSQKLKAQQNLHPYYINKTVRKNRILPESSHAFPYLSTEPDQNVLQRRKISEQIGVENHIDKYTKFVVKLNPLENSSSRNKEELKTMESVNLGEKQQSLQDSSCFSFQNFTFVNRVKQNKLKPKQFANDYVLQEILGNQQSSERRQLSKESFLYQQDTNASKIHLKIRNTNNFQSQPSVGIYNPNYSLIRRSIQTHRIQPIVQSCRISNPQKENDKSPLFLNSNLSPNKKKNNQGDGEDNYEKMFNKMMREIQKKVDLEQQQNQQGNLLHPDGDKELKKVMTSEEMEGFTNQYKKQMADMKNIFNRIRYSLNQNKQTNYIS